VKNEQQAKEMASRTLNAKGETAFEKPSFRKPIRSQRGLLGVSGFFEWREFKGKKYPYYVQVKDEELFSLGCIYDSWVDTETGEIRDTFSILTTPANPLMAVVHNQKLRMPLIIDRADEPRWVQPDLPHEDVRRLIKPFDDKKMTAYPVSNKINSPRNERNTPEAIRRVDYPELPPVNV
jgi:putative SOS response-associated peptidase YedK